MPIIYVTKSLEAFEEVMLLCLRRHGSGWHGAVTMISFLKDFFHVTMR